VKGEVNKPCREPFQQPYRAALMKVPMQSYSGLSGFLPGRASFMLDVVVVSMLFVMLALGWSVYAVKFGKMYRSHKVVQITLSSTLLIVLVLFEADVHYLSNWMERADASPYFDAPTRSGPVIYALGIHLFFAITTFSLWTFMVVRALNRFPSPPHPNQHSREHARWGRVAAIDMALTTITGWIFYWLAFVA
jgi:putative membrane protein